MQFICDENASDYPGTAEKRNQYPNVLFANLSIESHYAVDEPNKRSQQGECDRNENH